MRLNYNIYRMVACIDWIRLEVAFETPTNAQTVRRTLNGTHQYAQHKNAYVKPLDAGAAGEATRFQFSIQNPRRWRDIDAVLHVLRAWRPFAAQPRVVGIEVALDGYCNTATWRPELVALAEHFCVYLTRPASNNRRFGGLKGSVMGVHDRAQIHRMMDAGRPLVIGNNASDEWSQRIYVKSVDNAGKINLPECEHRARFENTYRQGGLPAQSLDGWASFRFESLSKHFNFTKPAAVDDALMAVVANANTSIGERRKRKNRTDGKVDGVRLYSANVIADTPLNRKSYDALRLLSVRWAK